MRPGRQPNFKQMMQLQQQLAAAQAELAGAELTGTAGGGLVTVTVSGMGEYKTDSTAPKPVHPADSERLEDLFHAAIHNAAEAVRRLSEEKMGPLTGALGIPGM